MIWDPYDYDWKIIGDCKPSRSFIGIAGRLAECRMGDSVRFGANPDVQQSSGIGSPADEERHLPDWVKRSLGRQLWNSQVMHL